jgi:hypothetical protein
VNASPLDPLRAVFGAELQDLSGTVVSGEVPVTTGLINRLIAQKLATANTPIVSAEIETTPGDSCTVHLRPKGPIPLLNVDAVIDQQPQLPVNPVLAMRWSLRGLGPLAMFAAPIVSYFKALPPGITLDRERLSVNVHTLLRSRGYGDIIPLLTGVRVSTRERRFVVQFEIKR